MKEITVKTSRPYNVIINKSILENIGNTIKNISSPCKIAVVTDETVYALYGKKVIKSLQASGFTVYPLVFPPGEKTKSITSLETLLESLASEEFTRSDLLLALGGGVIGDLTGFAASIYLRGIKYIQVPTTLLAAVDSSVGGKTAVNLKMGKNLAGTFWQPSAVIIDTATIETLPHEIFLDGLAEVIKTAILESKEFFNTISEDSIDNLIYKSIVFKKDIVEQDEIDLGLRQLLNLGHTAAHGIESVSGYTIHHGHAVALGLLIAAKASSRLGWSKEDCYTPIKELLLKLGYNIDCHFSSEDLFSVALRDKKRKGDKVTLIVPETIGSCYLKEVSLPTLEEFLKAGLQK